MTENSQTLLTDLHIDNVDSLKKGIKELNIKKKYNLPFKVTGNILD